MICTHAHLVLGIKPSPGLYELQHSLLVAALCGDVEGRLPILVLDSQH